MQYDLHIHTHYSQCSNNKPAEILKKANVNIIKPSPEQLADYERRARVTLDNAMAKDLFSRDQYNRIQSILKEYRATR